MAVEGNSSTTKRPALVADVGREPDVFDVLRQEWRALEQQAPPHSPTPTFDYARLAWQGMSKVGGVEPAVLTVRRGAQLVCVWSLFTRRHNGLSVASHLGCGSNHEYAGPLIVDDADTRAVAALALASARPLADVLRIYNLRPASAMACALDADRSLKFRGSVFSPVVSLAGFGDWQGWTASKPRKFSSELRRRRRRLAELGDLQSVRTSGSVEAAQIVDWLFEAKRKWLFARGIRRSWILEPRARTLFAALLSRHHADAFDKADFLVFALKLDGKTIAASLCSRSRDRLESHMTAFDPAFAAYAPGSLLTEDQVRWAIGERVDLDLRITRDPYKLVWADRGDRYDSFAIACSLRGVPTVLGEHVHGTIRSARRALGPRVKALFRRFGATVPSARGRPAGDLL